jgi:hypothetical protein
MWAGMNACQRLPVGTGRNQQKPTNSKKNLKIAEGIAIRVKQLILNALIYFWCRRRDSNLRI